ncbi:MAG: amino acid adenylation domain-containing protein [Bacteriovorax sp.]|nr:amino acid adenylation domain-containing protein [Bacteriovorax sp.]
MVLKAADGDLKKDKVTYNPFEAGPIALAVPSTEAQIEIWASIVMDPDATLCYNESLAINFQGNLNPEILNFAFQELLKKHDALRAAFSADGKTFFVKEYTLEPITVLDHANKSQSELEELKKAEVLFKYDLVMGPCHRAILVRTGYNTFTFLLSAHHIICDGWSFAILLNELSDFYNSISKNQIPNAEEASQFADFAVNEYKNGLDQEHKAYWLKEFETSLNTKIFPIDFKRPAYRTFNSTRYDITVSPETVKLVKKLGATQGCSFYSTLMSIFNVLLYNLTESHDIVVGMASAAQSGLGQNDLIGHLVNLLPLRTTIREDVPFNLFMKSVRSKMLDAFDHQFYSYGSLVKDLKNIKREPGQMPLLNVVFNIDQQTPDQGLRFDDILGSYHTTPREFENFEIFINAVSCGEKLTLECQYNTNLFSASTIENWMSVFIELMNEVAKDPKKGVKSFSLPFLKIPTGSGLIAEDKKEEIIYARNPQVEDRIKNIWSEVLLNNSVTVEDDFFSIGGHSLLAIEVATLLQAEFKTDFSIKDIFENPTIITLSHKIGSGLKPPKENLPALIASALTSTDVSHNQMQVWYLEEMHPNTLMHNLPASIRIKASVSREALEKTLHYIIERHPALRTCIVVEEGVPVQKVMDKNLARFKPRLELIKASEGHIIDLLNHEAQFSFDKKEPPLFKAKLYELSENDYVFFFMVHHAIWDGWSFDIFFEELNTVYTALIKNESPSFIKNPDITYADYSSWLHNLITERILNKQIIFWEDKLKGPLPILDLPLDYKRPLMISHEGSTFPFIVSADRASALRDYAKTQGASLFNVFLTAFKITLARYSGLDDIIVGLPVRGRTRPEVMQTIGYFVNTIVLRSDIHLNQSFEANLKHVSNNCIDAFDNQLIPFQIILNKVTYARDSSRTPVFQTFFSYQDVSNRSAEINGTPYTQINIDKASTHTDLDLWIKASDRKIEGAFEFRNDLFKPETVGRFSECFFHILNGLLENFNKPLNLLSSIPETQETLIIREWNNSWTAKDKFTPFHKIVEKNAKLNPHAIAIETTNGRMSYGELDLLSRRVANALIAKGVGRGSLVGISLTRTSQLVATILGVLKTGAGYVPLDPGFPQERLDYMIESSTPKILLTEESLIGRFKHGGEKILISNIINEDLFDKDIPFVNHALTDTIYVIYTSGSTGNPKGVQLTHGSVTNFLLSMNETISFNENDKILAVTTLSFDISVLELYLPLISGGTIYLSSSAEAVDGASLKNILNNKNISIMQATPSTWRLLLASGWKGNKNIKVLCGGEAFPIDLAKTLIPMCGAVWNMYGPTETTVWSACKKLSLDDSFITVGKPIANTSLYILDDNRHMKPIGATGELFIGGYGLAKGYFGRDDLTAERFLPDPFFTGEKMYATGDLARFTVDGEIECLGRNDGQVKVRGYRIELGEIEAAIQKIHEVQEVAVITSEYRPGDVRIFAYLATTNNRALDERMLREVLSKKLPSYMIPSHFTYMSAIPKTLNGKMDKKSLPKVQASAILNNQSVSVTEQRPSTAAIIANNHETLRQIWKEVLGVTELKNSDNFFDIGGNSLLAVQMFSKIAGVFKINLPLSTLIESDNFDSFANNLESKLPVSNESVISLKREAVSVIPQIYKSLVAIKSTGYKNPLFCFHGVGGNILNYVTLVPATKNERPLLALQSIGLDGITSPLRSIEEMATNYIREIKLAQPEGPYLLAGGSMGGMIALEVAFQLKKRGDTIDKLIMFDTFGPNLDLKSYNKKRKRPLFNKYKDALTIRSKNWLNKIQSKIYRTLGLPVPLSVLLIEIERKNYQAIWKYYPKERYSGELYLIRSRLESTGWYSDPVMGWNGIISGEIKTFEINGTHENFIESPELVVVLKKII